MPKTQTSCPNCRQPVLAEIEQLFDMNIDPQAKQRLMSGMFNLIRCPSCGYEGNLSTPIVYHDPDKELLLTFFPPDLGLPVNEQERLVGPFIKSVVDNLPQEKRKGYLFKPQTMLTMQTMVEKILEADGITKEMLEAQQNKVKLIERLMTASADAQLTIIKEEEKNIDQDFFALLARIIQASSMQGDQAGVEKISELQKLLFAETETGRELEAAAKETNDAIREIQEASKEGFTREKLLDILRSAETDTKLRVLVSVARSGIDYEFYALLTETIEAASDEEKEKLTALREKLLAFTQEIDQAVQVEMDRANQTLEKILAAPEIEAAVQQNVQTIDEFFVENLEKKLAEARQASDLEKIEKLTRVVSVIQSMSAPPPEVAFIEELISVDDAGQQAVLEKNAEKITPEFLQVFNNIVMQYEQQDNQPAEVKEKLRDSYQAALKFSMQKQLDS